MFLWKGIFIIYGDMSIDVLDKEKIKELQKLVNKWYWHYSYIMRFKRWFIIVWDEFFKEE